MSKNAIRAGLFGLGFISISTQIYLLRQSYIVFYGNELILGIMLSAWMLLTGAGAWLGRYFSRIKGPAGFVLFLMLLLSTLPVLMLVKLNLYRVLVLPTGTLAGINDVVYAAFLVQLPFCLINGFLFSALSFMSGKAGNAYSLESAGSLVSGALVNFILLWLCSSWLSILLLSGFYLVTVVYFSFHCTGRHTPWLTILISAILMIILAKTDIREISFHSLYPGQSVIEEKETPYGQLIVTTNAGQFNFYENGLLMFSSGDEINNEENVHYAMVQHALPEKVLLVSGGLSGAIGEILKYHPLSVDYIELNPALLKLNVRSRENLERKNVFLHPGDARSFLKNSSAVYDVILILLPPPSSLQINRMYTSEFLKELKLRLSPDGVVSYSLPTTSDYVSRAGEGLNSILYKTLKESFRNVMLVPGGKTYFIASDAVLSLDIPGMIERKGISTSYVNKYYLDTNQMKERAEYMQANISGSAGINYDFRPLMFFAQMNYWMTYFNRHYFISALILLLIVALVILNLNPVNTGLFTGGFTAGAFQVLIILSMQIYCGYVFQLTGFIIMLFMLGLALGSRAGTLWFSRSPFKVYLFLQLVIAALSVLIPLALILVGRMGLPLWMIQLKAAGITLVLSFLTGIEYSLAFRLSVREKDMAVAKNYSADLFGSALGAFIIPVFLFPLIGLMNTGFVLALMNTAAAAFLFIKRKNFVSL
ncbi:MAG: hypothetical protein NTY96_04455 [Bacteroidetes bacterium]|nr:hypothetical protein [Bacteroidota bacterium]